MRTIFLDAVFKPFFKTIRDMGQQLMIDRTNFLTDGFFQIIQCTGFVSVNTRFQILPKEKNYTLKDRENEGATPRLRNGKWGARETCFEQWSLTRLQCALWYHLVESGQPRGKECRPPRPPSSAYLLSTTHSNDVRFQWVTLYNVKQVCSVSDYACSTMCREHDILASRRSCRTTRRYMRCLVWTTYVEQSVIAVTVGYVPVDRRSWWNKGLVGEIETYWWNFGRC